MTKNTRRRRNGSVRQLPSGRWLARLTVGTRADGSRRTMSKTLDTKADAESWLMARSVELDARPDLDAGVTLRQLWEVYARSREGVLTTKTLSTYRWYMEGAKDGSVGSWLEWMGDVDASTITPAMVQARLDKMPRQKARHAKNAISSVLTWAARSELLATNPLRGHRFEYKRDDADEDPFDNDPFAAIERTRDVWGMETALACFDLIHGLPLEPAWLCCVGAGLRVEEALALRRMDVRRVPVDGREVTQLAVHAARTNMDERKTTKTPQSRRIVAMLEPFGGRYWEVCKGITDRKQLVCPVSAQNQNKRWRGYFEPPSTSKHAPRKEGFNNRGALCGLPYLPLSKMRNTHVTIMAEAGVSDSINALIHGHTEMVERRHYLSPDATRATLDVSRRFQMLD